MIIPYCKIPDTDMYICKCELSDYVVLFPKYLRIIPRFLIGYYFFIGRLDLDENGYTWITLDKKWLK